MEREYTCDDFKVGQQVICVDAECYKLIKNDVIYTITKISHPYVYVDGMGGFLARRFKPKEEPPKEEEPPNLTKLFHQMLIAELGG